MTDRPEWEKCICSGGHQDPSICGRPFEPFDWRFVDVAHAVESIAQGSRMVPCSECMRVVRETTGQVVTPEK